MKDYTIPRNIRVKEGIMGTLNVKQLAYMGVGLGGCLGFMASGGCGLPFTVKAAVDIALMSGAVGFAVSKVNGQDIDRYVYNAVKFPLRQKEYGGEAIAIVEKQSPLVVIGSRGTLGKA